MSILSRLTGAVRSEFKHTEGKSLLERWDDPNDRQMVRAKRIMTVSGVGAASAGAIGAIAGGVLAQRAIERVPIEQKTVDYRVPNIERQEVGRIPSDFYQDVASGQPNPAGRPATVPIYKDNPVYRGDNTPDLKPASQNFSGHGTPTVHWKDNEIVHHGMTGNTPSVNEVTHQQYDHTEHWTEQVPYDVPYTVTESVPHQVPYTESEQVAVQVAHTTYESVSTPHTECVDSYNSNGSTSQDCHTSYSSEQVPHTSYETEYKTENVTKYRTEYRDEQVTKHRTEYRTEPRSRDVYKTILDGWNVNYRPNIQDRVVGHYQTPSVTFEHGISVGGYIGKGLLIGAVIGAVGLGLMAAIEDKHFHLPGWKELPPEAPPVDTNDHDDPKPPVDPKPPGGPNDPPSHPTHPPVDPHAPTEPEPKPPIQPKPPKPPAPEPPKDYGGYKKHSHNGTWHAHDGGDRWHYHGCPSDSDVLANPANTDWICFKPDQVPSGYDISEGKQCPENGSICFVEKGRKS